MAEPTDLEIEQYEKIKRGDGVDEGIQHWLWLKHNRDVSMDEIRRGPDRLFTYMTAKLNAQFSAKDAVAVPKEDSHARRKT